MDKFESMVTVICYVCGGFSLFGMFFAALIMVKYRGIPCYRSIYRWAVVVLIFSIVTTYFCFMAAQDGWR